VQYIVLNVLRFPYNNDFFVLNPNNVFIINLYINSQYFLIIWHSCCYSFGNRWQWSRSSDFVNLQ